MVSVHGSSHVQVETVTAYNTVGHVMVHPIVEMARMNTPTSARRMVRFRSFFSGEGKGIAGIRTFSRKKASRTFQEQSHFLEVNGNSALTLLIGKSGICCFALLKRWELQSFQINFTGIQHIPSYPLPLILGLLSKFRQEVIHHKLQSRPNSRQCVLQSTNTLLLHT